ncbi:MAG: ABC transporter substrate-binding protein [Eubacteriales bacterium]|nr:ABC transporter substrate-binding protein [Eubacteriales bacterium]
MKKTLAIALVLIIALATTLSGCTQNDANSDLPKIGIIQYVEHPSLDTIRENIIVQLEEEGYVDGETATIVYKNGQGDTNNLKTIAQSLESEKCDIIIAIATPAAQATAKIKDTPIIFSAVTDPVSAGLVKSMDNPGGNITGTSDAVSASKIMELAKRMVPNVKSVGALYSSAEVNSLSVINDLKDYAGENNLKVIEKQIMNTSELQQAAQSFDGKVDIVFSPIDNNVASAISAAVKVFNETDTPYFVSADSMVKDGGLATYGISYVELGQKTGKMTAEVLRGADPATMPVQVMSEVKIYINKNTAEAIGLEISEEILAEATDLAE